MGKHICRSSISSFVSWKWRKSNLKEKGRSMPDHTPGPWRWITEDGTELVGSPDQWLECQYWCFGWRDGSQRSRGPRDVPGHEHNSAPSVLAAMGYDDSGQLLIDPESPDGYLIAAAPDLLKACKQAVDALHFTREYVGEGLLPAIEGWSWYDATLALQTVIAKAKGDDRGKGEHEIGLSETPSPEKADSS